MAPMGSPSRRRTVATSDTETTMKLDWKTTALAAGLLLLTRATAPAVVLDEKTAAQKLRADVGSQLARYVKCIGAATVACEKTGDSTAAECDAETGIATPPADPKAKFAKAIAKCDAKLDFDRKGPKGNSSLANYELIGCPSYGSGLQFSSMAQFQSFAPLLKPVVGDLVAGIAFASGCDDAKACANASKVMAGFVDALGNCELRCENDYKDKKGNGGPTDALAQCDLAGDPRAQLCIDKAVDTFVDKAEDWPFRDLAVTQVSALFDDFYDDLFNAPANCD